MNRLTRVIFDLWDMFYELFQYLNESKMFSLNFNEILKISLNTVAWSTVRLGYVTNFSLVLYDRETFFFF